MRLPAVDTRPGRPELRTVLTAFAIGSALLTLPGPVQAQEECFRSWTRPVVCELRLEYRNERGRWRRVEGRDRLRIPAGGSLDLRVEGRDQDGWRFPDDRLQVGIDLESDCRGLVFLADNTAGGRYRLVAGTERGRCEAIVWLPGNMNLDTPLRLEVISRARAGYTEAQARAVARRLYLAILGRRPDPAGWRAATLEIQRGRLKEQIHGMVTSAEFRTRQKKLSAANLLEDLYKGLLDREPDSQGVRTYLRRLERGQSVDVIYDIIRSPEFESELLDSSKPSSRHNVRPGD